MEYQPQTEIHSTNQELQAARQVFAEQQIHTVIPDTLYNTWVESLQNEAGPYGAAYDTWGTSQMDNHTTPIVPHEERGEELVVEF